REIHFNPALLISSDKTSEFVVQIPPAEATLQDSVRYVAALGVAGECADAKAMEMLESQLEDAQNTVRTVLSQQRLDSLRSTSGQMRLKEEILSSLKRLLKTDDLKEVYFDRLTFAPAGL